MSKINTLKRIDNLEKEVQLTIETFNNKIDNEHILINDDFDSKINNLESKLESDVTRIEDIANFKEFRFVKPVNKIYGVTAGMTQVSIDFDFHPDVMEVRLDGVPLIHKSHSSQYYDYSYSDNLIIFKKPLISDAVLWIRSETTLDLKMHIEREYIYEEYQTKYGNIQKRLHKEIWTGDIVKEVTYHYNDSLNPFRITKEVVLRGGEEYIREYEYTSTGVKTKSTEGLEDYFVQRLLGGEDLTRTEIKVINMTEAEIKHDLGYMFPFVQVWSDNQLCLCVIECLDENTIKVKTYDDPITGYVIVRK